MNHKQTCAARENVCFLAVVLRVDGQLPQLAVKVAVFEVAAFVCLEFQLFLMQIYVVVPDLGGVINF